MVVTPARHTESELGNAAGAAHAKLPDWLSPGAYFRPFISEAARSTLLSSTVSSTQQNHS